MGRESSWTQWGHHWAMEFSPGLDQMGPMVRSVTVQGLTELGSLGGVGLLLDGPG